MTGKWKTVYFKWELPTYQNKDTLIEYDVDLTIHLRRHLLGPALTR